MAISRDDDYDKESTTSTMVVLGVSRAPCCRPSSSPEISLAAAITPESLLQEGEYTVERHTRFVGTTYVMFICCCRVCRRSL